MSDVFDHAIGAITDVKTASAQLGDLQEQIKITEARLKAAKGELADVKAKQSDEIAGHQKLIRQHVEDTHAKYTELQEATAQADAARGKLKEVEAQVGAATLRHDQVLASIEQLRSRLG